MLYSRYGTGADKVLLMDPLRGWNQYVSALNKSAEEKLFTRWVNGYQTQMGFDEFKRKAGYGPPEKKTTKEEALEKVRRILDGDI